MNELLERLQDVFRQVFHRPGLALTPELTAGDVPGWDSLKHIELIVSIEEAFGVRFKTVEVGSLNNVGELCAALQRKLQAGPR